MSLGGAISIFIFVVVMYGAIRDMFRSNDLTMTLVDRDEKYSYLIGENGRLYRYRRVGLVKPGHDGIEFVFSFFEAFVVLKRL